MIASRFQKFIQGALRRLTIFVFSIGNRKPGSVTYIECCINIDHCSSQWRCPHGFRTLTGDFILIDLIERIFLSFRSQIITLGIDQSVVALYSKQRIARVKEIRHTLNAYAFCVRIRFRCIEFFIYWFNSVIGKMSTIGIHAITIKLPRGTSKTYSLEFSRNTRNIVLCPAFIK